MWKILIIEDEVHVRKSFRKHIDWRASGFEVIGEASNGARALEFMKEHQPELVICDIIMPVMNGIELLKKAREAGLPCLFVMLTCMNEFEYARSALQHGAFDYILKLSMDADTLRDILAKVDEQLSRSTQQASHQLYLEYQPIYQGLWDSLTQLKQDQVANFYRNRLHGAWPYVAICTVLNGSEPFSIEDGLSLGLVSQNKQSMIHHFSAWGHTTLFFWSRNEIQVSPFEQSSSPFPIVVGGSVPSTQLFEAWRSTLRKLDTFWYSRESGIHSFDLAEQTQESDHWVAWKIERKLIQYFEQAKMNECEALLREIWDRMEQGVFPMYVVKHTANQFNKWVSRITNYPFGEPDALLHCTSHKQLLAVLMARLQAGLGNRKGIQASLTDHGEINKMLDYMHEHYDQNMNLKSMAQFVALEEHYLSTLFKKKTGENFIEYLHRVRIEKAKYFMDHTDMTVSDVGERVGFLNDNYFIKIFKRYTNMTPTMYRQLKAK